MTNASPSRRCSNGSTAVGRNRSRLPRRGDGSEWRGAGYDIFISYAHKQDQEVRAFVQELQRLKPRLRIFHDRSAIPMGGQWIKLISDAVHDASMFIAVLSPDYTASPVCWDEFQCAKLKEYNTRTSVIKTVRLYSEQALPPIIGIYSYVDCVEGDLVKLRACASTVVS